MPIDYAGPQSERGRLRFILGDKDPVRALLDDDELDYLITLHETVEAAVIPAVRRMIAVASSHVDWRSGQEQETASQRLKALENLERRLLEEGYPAPVTGIVGSRVRQFTRPSDDPREI